MQRTNFLKALVIIPFAWLAACEGKNESKTAEAGQQTYTCPMHPQIIQHKPGTCPICGMDLVPFEKNNTDASLTLSESQMALANITVMTAGRDSLSNYKQLNGRLAVDPERTAVISARIAGRIETLQVRETGVKVEKGQPLYSIYSEQLASLQQEYLVTAAQVREFPGDAKFRQLEEGARQKLRLYGQSDVQISQLMRSGKTSPYVTYAAPVSGMVAELSISPGQYVQEGSAIMRLEGYDRLWVEADIYPAEARAVQAGQSVKVAVAGWEHEPREMTIQFIDPALQSNSQRIQVRGTVNNPGRQWQPGQQVNILLPVKSNGNTLNIPVDAVIREAAGAHVWIAEGKGKFRPQPVKTGMETFDAVEITEGLEEGDRVVITGAYLLYSEYILKRGMNPTAAHQH